MSTDFVIAQDENDAEREENCDKGYNEALAAGRSCRGKNPVITLVYQNFSKWML